MLISSIEQIPEDHFLCENHGKFTKKVGISKFNRRGLRPCCVKTILGYSLSVYFYIYRYRRWQQIMYFFTLESRVFICIFLVF